MSLTPVVLSLGLAQRPIGAESPLSQTDLIQAPADASVALHAHDYTVNQADRVGNGNLSPVGEAEQPHLLVEHKIPAFVNQHARDIAGAVFPWSTSGVQDLD